MYISKININNYRLLNNTDINCEKDLSLIIGKNNCGKTSLLSILSKCIGSDIGNFDYYDFSISFQKKLYEVIKEKASFVENELTGIRVDLYIEYDDNDNLSNISKLLLDLDPDNKTVILRFDYFLKNDFEPLKEDFAEYKSTKKNLTPEKAFTKFCCKNHKKYFEFNKYSVLYDYKSKDVDNKTYKLIDKDVDISKLIAFNSVSARRNVSNTTGADLSILANNYYEKSKKTDENKITTLKFEDEVDKTDKAFDGIYSETFKNLMEKISRFGGIKKEENTLKVISQIQVSKLLKDNTTVVYDDQSNFLPEHYNGLGYLNLFSIIMNIETLLSDFRRDTKEDEQPSDINLLFIEEPEAHTHPQMQYIFIKNIKDLLEDGKKLKDSDKSINLQTFMTTHSSHIVAESSFDDIKYFVKIKEKDGFNIISKNLKDLETLYQKEKGKDNNHFKFLKQYLTLNRSEVFFADKIILIEGDTERILLPAMIKKLDQEKKFDIPLLSQNISIIEVGNYSEIYSEFIKFIDTKTLIITDIDINKYSDYKDEQGNPKKNNDGTTKQVLDPCRVEDGTHTSNSALKYYLKNKLESKEGNQKELLTKLTLDEKIVKFKEPKNLKNQKKSNWISDKHGNILIVYQTNEKNCDGISYNARSFEDAFFHINRKLFTDIDGDSTEEKEKNCSKNFQSLKNTNDFFDSSKDSYDLAKDCVKKKPSLAMDILLNSKIEDEKLFSNWETPAYIKEGLEWLQKD